MYRRIVAGYDGSERSEDALALARELRELTGAALTVAGVLQYEDFLDGSMTATTRPAAELHRQRRDEVLRDIEPAAEIAEADAVAVASPSVARGLHTLAERTEADLLVVGSSARGRAGRVFAGSVAERLFHGAPCPVAVAPRGFAGHEGFSFETIGVGYDGKPESELALREGARLSESFGAALKVYAVTPFGPQGKRWHLELDVVDLAQRDHLKQTLEAAVAALPESVPAEGVLLAGHPVEVLAEQDADLLVVGSRGYGPMRAVLLGGVSGALVRRATTPVLVLPRAAADGDEGEIPPAAA